MKNRILILGTAALVLGMLLVTAMPGDSGGNGKTRVFVSGNSVSKFVVKNTFAVQHGFKDGFTVEVDARGLATLEQIPGIKTEEVQLYHISGRPVCGDGICQGNEPKTCPEDCGTPTTTISTTTTVPSRSCFSSVQIPWGIDLVNGGSGGAGVKVAVLDTGVYKDHLDLKANIVDCKDTTKRGIKNGCADRDGHGTHVAGTIAANAGSDGLGIYGVAPEAKLMAIKVCGPTGCWTDDIAAGIRYAADNGANIISMSLGGDTQSDLIKAAIDYAVDEKRVLVVAAAGNDGHIDGYGSIDYPAANVEVVAVAAFDSSDNMAYFSSIGVNDNDWTMEEREIEFAAPGVDVESTWNDGCYETISGTSMSTPHVAGIAARDWKESASATRAYLQELAKLYTENIKDYGLSGDDIEAGFGLPIVVPAA